MLSGGHEKAPFRRRANVNSKVKSLKKAKISLEFFSRTLAFWATSSGQLGTRFI